ncbi:MAG TPA: OmpA family protein [Anaeromyxobacter sp.]|nr:OmpA family protein [Anaeromyxobacter sp.]
MRRVLLLALCVSGALALTACPAKPKNGECKSSQDCADQSGYGKVCVQGRCQECGADADCQAGFVCRSNKCTPKPQCSADTDCAAGQMCQGERCVSLPPGTCHSDRDCGEGSCQNGKCVAAATQTMAAPSEEVPAECKDASRFTIRFGFDQATLTSDSQSTLQSLADCLKKSPARRVTVQGNCDERGTAQYNVALGSRRADAARKYLSDLGVTGTIDTVSFGKEKPLCKQATEDCWAKNRRDDFVFDRK